jgi:hypothetical protein
VSASWVPLANYKDTELNRSYSLSVSPAIRHSLSHVNLLSIPRGISFVSIQAYGATSRTSLLKAINSHFLDTVTVKKTFTALQLKAHTKISGKKNQNSKETTNVEERNQLQNVTKFCRLLIKQKIINF